MEGILLSTLHLGVLGEVTINWDNLLSTLLGGLLGGSGAIGAQFLAHRLNDGRARKAMAGAFAGEIAAVCEIARRRNYLKGLELQLKQVHETGVPSRLQLHISQDYFQVYQSNAHARLSPFWRMWFPPPLIRQQLKTQ